MINTFVKIIQMINMKSSLLIFAMLFCYSINVTAQSGKVVLKIGTDTLMVAEDSTLCVFGKIVSDNGFTDTDGDTNIDLERFTDDDVIRFSVDNTMALWVGKNVMNRISATLQQP